MWRTDIDLTMNPTLTVDGEDIIFNLMWAGANIISADQNSNTLEKLPTALEMFRKAEASQVTLLLKS